MMAKKQSSERPVIGLLLSAPLVRAALAGDKTITRRIARPQPSEPWFPITDPIVAPGHFGPRRGMLPADAHRCPYGAPGQRLAVLEGYRLSDVRDDGRAVCHYLADGATREVKLTPGELAKYRKRKRPNAAQPGRFMYRSCVRLVLVVEAVDVQRIQSISSADILAEGVRIPVSEEGRPLIRLTGRHPPTAFLRPTTPEERAAGRGWTEEELLRAEFASLWCEINGPESWDRNDWTWVIRFRVEKGGR